MQESGPKFKTCQKLEEKSFHAAFGYVIWRDIMQESGPKWKTCQKLEKKSFHAASGYVIWRDIIPILKY